MLAYVWYTSSMLDVCVEAVARRVLGVGVCKWCSFVSGHVSRAVCRLFNPSRAHPFSPQLIADKIRTMIQANAPVKRGRSGSNDRRLQTAWPRDVGGLSSSASAVGNDDLLASEMAESLRKLTAARFEMCPVDVYGSG